MNSERLRQIAEIYHAAAEIAPARHASFFDKTCGADIELRREVETLLAFENDSHDFLDALPESIVAEMFAERAARDSDFINRQIGRYKIKRLLGRGGMGEVYLAEDVTLNRKVALKFLAAVNADKNWLRRFEREAFAASALNHPNILTIYEFVAENELNFLVTEYVEGETLRDKLMRDKLTLREILNIAEQTAFALSAACRAGIVHRDIKPENIMLREDGIVKVLDFGLAKLITSIVPAASDDVASSNESENFSRENTNSSGVMGTLAYMSPEQARGAADVDGRADIWSFGVVLYEMFFGEIPFAGEMKINPADVRLKNEPIKFDADTAEISPELLGVLKKTLRKNRAERYQNINDLLDDLCRLKIDLDVRSKLERARATPITGDSAINDTKPQPFIHSTGNSESETAPFTAESFSNGNYSFEKNGLPWRAPRFVAAALISLLIGFGFYGFYGYSNYSQTKSVGVSFEPLKQTRLTNLGRVADATISPDGRFLAYVAKIGLRNALYRKEINSGETETILPAAETAYRNITFSPDGVFVYFLQNDERKNITGDLYRIASGGGAAQKLIADVDSMNSFSPDGQRIAFRRNSARLNESAIFIADADGANERKVAAHQHPYGFIESPVWLSDGQTLVAAMHNGDASELYAFSLIAINVADGAEKPLGAQKWDWITDIKSSPAGNEILLNAPEKTGEPHQLWRVALPGGEASKITDDFNQYKGAGITADDSRLVSVKNVTSVNLFIAPIDDLTRARQITAVDGVTFSGVSWMPDGKIVYASNAGGKRDIWTMKPDGGDARQITKDKFSNFNPLVTADGKYIVYESDRSGKPNIWCISVDGGEPFQITDGAGEFQPTVTPDNQSIVYAARGLWKVPLNGGAAVQIERGDFRSPVASPDGKMLAVNYWDGGDSPVRLSIFPLTGESPLRSFNVRADLWQWTKNSRKLIFVDSSNGYSNLFEQPLDGGNPKQISSFKGERIFGFDISPDGRQIVFLRGAINSDVVMISNFH